MQIVVAQWLEYSALLLYVQFCAEPQHTPTDDVRETSRQLLTARLPSTWRQGQIHSYIAYIGCSTI
jgi:hypothetical protein